MVSYTVWCAIVAGDICSELSDCVGSATVVGTVRDSVFKPCILLNRVLKLEYRTLLHLIDKGMVKESRSAETEILSGALRTAVAVFAHRMCTIWCKSLSQALKCISLTPHEASELAKLQVESYVVVR